MGCTLALVDVRLPDGDGLVLAPALKERTAHAEIILLTGFATLESAISAVRLRRGSTTTSLPPRACSAMSLPRKSGAAGDPAQMRRGAGLAGGLAIWRSP